MTPARQPQHCDHECVCLFFDHDSKIAKNDGTPCMRNAKGCANCCRDTRIHTRAPAPDADKLLNALILWLNDNRTGAIIRPYGEEKEIMVLDCERTIKQIKAMWPRTHTSPKTPTKKEYELTEDIAFIRSKTMNCKGCESNTCAEVCQQWQKEHDAQVAKAAREQVLKDAITTINDRLAVNWTPDREGLQKAKILIESLRAQQEPQQ